uniref:Ovule protein n=1 Tax=Heterorhabditis bacteriophora TaxID=37862 RepID=A0A1I7WB77_HETBA
MYKYLQTSVNIFKHGPIKIFLNMELSTTLGIFHTSERIFVNEFYAIVPLTLTSHFEGLSRSFEGIPKIDCSLLI